MFQKATEGLDEITPATVLDSVGTLDYVTLPGMAPTDVTGTRASDIYPQISDPTVQLAKVENGAHVPDSGDWVDVDLMYIP